MKKYINTNAIVVFASLFALEIIFHLIAFSSMTLGVFLRLGLYALTIALVIDMLTSLLPKKSRKIICILVVAVLCIYGYVELEFKNFLDNYYSFAAVSDGAGRIKDYVITFIKDAKPVYYCCLIPLLACLLLMKYADSVERKPLHALFLIPSAVLSFLLCLLTFQIDSTPALLQNNYQNFQNTEFLLNRIGLEHFLVRDLNELFFPKDKQMDLIIEETSDPVETENAVTEITYQIDDSKLNSDCKNENDNAVAAIDQYLLSGHPNTGNQDTGLYQGDNFIYILVESLDYTAIDPQLTPTLYKMFSQGRTYLNHYTPKYSCTTGESEFIALTSLVPYNDVCTPNVVTLNAYPEALPQLFKNAGYYTSSYHNWDDQYYDRHSEHQSFGFEQFYDVYDLNIPLIQGWQSDVDLVEKAVDDFIDKDSFFAFILSSSMHWPYDENSVLGNRYLDKVNEVHPDYSQSMKRYLSKCIEFDKAMERLLQLLDEHGKAENTVICLYADHHPFKLPVNDLRNMTTLSDRSGLYGGDKTPFLFYGTPVEHEMINNINSTFDQTPTIANLFALNFDSRLYVGSDIADNECTVIYPNADWIDANGVYILSENKFYPFGSVEYDASQIEKKNARVNNKIRFSYNVMSIDYFAKRLYLGNPSWIKIEQNVVQ